MKANQFANSEDAVSPVIGVILMVAITVVLAAVVFVLVSDLSGGEDKAESVAFKADSPRPEILTVTLLKEGENAPYNANTLAASDSANDVDVSINGIACVNDGAQADFTLGGGDDQWGAGEVATFDFTTLTGPNTGCAPNTFDSGDEVTVTVTVRGTLVFDDNVVIR